MYRVFGSVENGLAEGELFIYLHGLPGIRSKQNQDLAEIISILLDKNSVIFFYPGLGVAQGVFSFQTAYLEISDFIKDITSKNPKVKIHLVGHSFGGYLSLRLCKDFSDNINSVFLLSPLVSDLSDERVFDLFKAISETYSYIKTDNILDLQKEYRGFCKGYNVEDLKKYLANKRVRYIQSASDEITPASTAREFIKDIPSVEYEEVDQDHSFLQDRHQLVKLLQSFIQNDN